MSLSVLFMGTPDFAVPCLARILADGHRVAGVISQPDRPRGRGMSLAPTPVKEAALAGGLPVYQPAKLRDGAALSLIEALKPDLAVVVAYGRILPPELLRAPKLGCINVHASLLPRLRGAAPIQWSIIRGDTVTGVTTMHMAEGLDTGDIILQRETAIGEAETAGRLFARLAALGAELLGETLPLLEAGRAPRIPQSEALATHAPPLCREDARLDLTRPAKAVCDLVRGTNPAPGAWLEWNGRPLKVHEAAPVAGIRGTPGELLDKKRFLVACGEGAAELLTVQPQGKKAMSGGAYLLGRR